MHNRAVNRLPNGGAAMRKLPRYRTVNMSDAYCAFMSVLNVASHGSDQCLGNDVVPYPVTLHGSEDFFGCYSRLLYWNWLHKRHWKLNAPVTLMLKKRLVANDRYCVSLRWPSFGTNARTICSWKVEPLTCSCPCSCCRLNASSTDCQRQVICIMKVLFYGHFVCFLLRELIGLIVQSYN